MDDELRERRFGKHRRREACIAMSAVAGDTSTERLTGTGPDRRHADRAPATRPDLMVLFITGHAEQAWSANDVSILACTS